MLIIPRYLLLGTVWPTAVALVIMLSIIWLLQSMRFLDFVINKGLGIETFLTLTGLLIPRLLTIILPLGVFAGAAYAFKRLGDDAELTSLFAAGRSRWQVVKPSILLAFMLVAFGYILHMHLLPASTSAFKDLQYHLRNEQADLLLEEGTFNQIGKNLMVYVKNRESSAMIPLTGNPGASPASTRLNLLLVHDTRNAERPVTWMAKSGELVVAADGSPQLLLREGLRQEVSPKRAEMLEFAQHTIDLQSQLNPDALKKRMPEVEESGFIDLWTARNAENPTIANEMRAEAHKRLLWPLAPLPLILWAAACLLQVPGRRQSTMRMLAIATVGAVIYIGLMLGLRGAAEGGNPAILYGQWLLPVVLMAVSLHRIKHHPYG